MNNKLLNIGQQMSNVCYNLKQDSSLPQHVRDTMERLCKEWDEAVKEFRYSDEWRQYLKSEMERHK